jgi:hypothetical protein
MLGAQRIIVSITKKLGFHVTLLPHLLLKIDSCLLFEVWMGSVPTQYKADVAVDRHTNTQPPYAALRTMPSHDYAEPRKTRKIL